LSQAKYIIHSLFFSRILLSSRETILISHQKIGSHTLQSFGFFGGFIDMTGLHSVIQYHSNIFHFGQYFLKFSAKLSGHFSAQTTAYFKLFKSSAFAIFKIIFKKVGVAVRALILQCFIKFVIVLLSFGSGV
jgi:hypothetical protein